MEDINYLAVIVAAASSFLLGGLWYSPILFLKPWNKAMGRTEDDEQPHPARTFGLGFLFALVAAFVFAWLVSPPSLIEGLRYGLLAGLGLVAMCFGINYQFADRPFSALFIDGGYHTLQFALYGVIIGVWH